jgi:disulfide bond formation protein DsbB
MSAMISAATSRTLNALGLIAICAVLVVGFVDQLGRHDLPCPLCLLQRVGFVAVGFGLSLNLIYGSGPRHYGIMLLGALFGGGVSVRQTLLHIVPGTGTYGDPFLGLHFYVWGVVCFFLVILGTAVMLIVDPPAEPAERGRAGGSGLLARGAVLLLLTLAAGNTVSALLECGFGQCPDDPTDYLLLNENAGG